MVNKLKVGSALVLVSMFVLVGCTQDKSPVDEVPKTVLDKYYLMAEEFSQSLGAFLDKCGGDNTIYIVTGSGGYSEVSHYFTEDGKSLGSAQFTDVAGESAKPPVDVSNHTCTILKKSKLPVQIISKSKND